MSGGAVEYIYKFPKKWAFCGQQTQHIPGVHETDAQLVNCTKFVALSQVCQCFRLDAAQRHLHNLWLHTHNLFEFAASSVTEKNYWPLYLVQTNEQSSVFYIVHPKENTKLEAWISGTGDDTLHNQFERLLDLFKWHPKWGSVPKELQQEFHGDGESVKKRKIT